LIDALAPPPIKLNYGDEEVEDDDDLI